ncbi:hypothetical protein LTR22_013923 [Elasticomyces elasticus]|nr:hypothetical protein LTR22_013923 [Elasticomyces elasticus]KAK4918566.1 hypothetical protein LTR49_013636 [Elasticomyces elasticus]KAK5756087.1 hypothetical protein LTS12_013770 [Elasticomyces elasticus]
MAASPGASLEPGSRDIEADEYHHGEVQVEDSQYCEAHETVSVPTKTGEDEVVSETQHDDYRPRTADSAYSGTSHFNSTDDGATLAELVVESKTTEPIPSSSKPFFSRPDKERAITPKFSFAQATNKTLDFVGTRKGPIAAAAVPAPKVVDTRDRTPDREETHPQNGTVRPIVEDHAADEPTNTGQDAIQDGMPQHEQVPVYEAQELAEQTIVTEYFPPEQQLMDQAVDVDQEIEPAPPPEPTKKKRKKRKRKIVRDEPAPEPGQFPNATPAVAAFDERNGGFDADFALPSIEQAVEASQPELREEEGMYHNARPATPLQQRYAPNNEVIEVISSPHSQLQHDLQAAIRQEPEASNAPDDLIDGEDTLVGDADDSVLAEQPSPKIMHNQHRRTQPAHASHGRPRGIARRPLRRPESSMMLNRNTAARRSVAPTPDQPDQQQPAEHFSSDGIGEVQDVLMKLQRKKETLKSKFDADRATLNAELQQINEAKQRLQADLDAVQQQKGDLSALLEQQRSKVAAYDGKLNKFKVFVQGLGNDVDALRKEASTTRRNGEKLTQEGEQRKAEQAALFEQLSSCAEKSAQLKDQALKACQEAHSELQAAHLRNEYLEKQLGERIGLLAEERDRCSQLQRQLTTVVQPDNTAFLATLKRNNDIVLDKLFEIHATLEESVSNTKPVEMVEKTLAAIQALTTQHSSNADDILSVKAIVESMEEGITTLTQGADLSRNSEAATATALQNTLVDSFKDLKTDLERREQLLKQDAAYRENVRSLQDKITASNVRSNDLQAKLHDTELREARLKDANAALQTRIDTVHTNATPDDTHHLPLSELKAEVNAKALALESAKAELTTKTEELQILRETNSRLEEKTQSLEQQLDELKRQVIDVDVLRRDIQGKADAELKKRRKELQEHSDRNTAEHKMKLDNAARTLSSQKESLEKRIPALNEEIAASKTKIEELQKQATELTKKKDGEVEKTKKQAQEWKRKAEGTQTQLESLQEACKSDEALQKQYDAVRAELAQEKDKYHQSVEQKAVLAKQVEEIQQTFESARSEVADVKAQFERHQVESGAALEEKSRQLTEAEEALERSETGIAHLKVECKKEVAHAERKAKQHGDDLQASLTQAQDELKQEKAKAAKFQGEIDDAWRSEEAKQEQNLATANNRAFEAETKLQEAVAEAERLRKELESVVARHAEEQLRLQQRAVQDAAIRVPPAQAGITSAASNKENEPPKIRKKVDRNAHTVIATGPVVAPDILRQPAPRVRQPQVLSQEPVIEETQFEDLTAEKVTRGPVVEETQLEDLPIKQTVRGPVVEESQLKDLPVKRMPTHEFSGMSDDMLDTGSAVHNPQSTQVVEESHYDDKLPSFGSLHRAAPPLAPSRKHASSAISVPRVSGQPNHSNTSGHFSSNPSGGHVHSTSSGHINSSKSNMPLPANDPHNFAIYDDEPQSQMTMGTQAAQEQIQASLDWTDVDKAKYTYQKAYPPPNSASKRVHQDSQREPQNKLSTAREIEKGATPDAYGGSRVASGGRNNTPDNATHSSTPDFVDQASARQLKSTYTPQGFSNKRRPSGNHPGLIADPRLAQRAAPTPKRKAVEHPTITAGYEAERSKRRKADESGNVRSSTDSNRYALRGSTQPSIRDLPTIERPGSGRSTSHNPSTASHTRSHMRTSGGGTYRGSRGSKKMSKDDEMKARFQQEMKR